MDIIIWTKFDKEPITLRAVDRKDALRFEERVRSTLSPQWDYATLRGADGFHMIRREHIVRVYIPLREEDSDDNGTV